jgi:glycosyltransferase involved in cell wall biosynthesis
VDRDPSIAVVICVYTEQRWDQILEAVASVLAQTRPADEIVLVVDHNEALRERLVARLASTPRTVVVPNSEPQGLSGGRNSGVTASTSDIVAFLDDDAAAVHGWLEGLAHAYRDPKVIAAGGGIEPIWATRRPSWWPRSFDWVVGCTYEGMPTTIAPVRNVIGANMSFRRSTLERVGGFVHGVGRGLGRPMGGEETELSIRASRDDPSAVILYVPEASVRHHVPAGRANLRYFLRRCYAEGLSKATVTRLQGASAGLASERRHAMVTLPKAALRDLAGSIRHLDPALAGQSAAITLGLATTTLGYVIGSVGAKIRG